jgi:hypothetical protein
MAIKNVVALGFYDDEFLPTFGFTPVIVASSGTVVVLHLGLGYPNEVRLALSYANEVALSFSYKNTLHLLMGYDG